MYQLSLGEPLRASIYVGGKEYKSAFRQIWENLMLILRIQLEPYEYYLFELCSKKVSKGQAIDYLNSAQLAGISTRF